MAGGEIDKKPPERNFWRLENMLSHDICGLYDSTTTFNNMNESHKCNAE